MNELKKQLDHLRDLLHDSTFVKRNAWAKKEKGNWSKLWSAFDNLEDTIQAVSDFVANENPKQLETYGVLQALVVQQDAIKHLEEAIGLKVTDFEGSSALSKVRNVRDETIGHPTSTVRNNSPKSSYKGGTITYTSISPSMSKKQLEYVVWSSDNTEILRTNLLEDIEEQDKELSVIIKNIVDKLSDAETEHTQKFKHDSLAQLFNQSDYYVQKLWPFEENRTLSKVCLEGLEDAYRKFKNGVKARYGHNVFNDHAFIPGIVLGVEKVDKLFPKIKEMIEMNEGTDALDLEVYVESLMHAIDELKDMAREVDEKFGYEPEG